MFAAVLADLSAEHGDLDGVVASLGPQAWEAATPSPGWAVRDQIGHLAFFDARAREAVTDPDGFATMVAALRADPQGEDRWMDEHLSEARALAPAELLEWWRDERRQLMAALAVTDPSARIPWFGPPMGAVSFATARLMETWAHGQDVADGVGVTRLPTARLRHVADIGVRALPFSYLVHGRQPPSEPVRVVLRSPDHDEWVWGPAEAADVVAGPALDFCLVVTQRRHRADTDLVIEGPLAEDWMSIAQAFAGGPGIGRRPGQFAAG